MLQGYISLDVSLIKNLAKDGYQFDKDSQQIGEGWMQKLLERGDVKALGET